MTHEPHACVRVSVDARSSMEADDNELPAGERGYQVFAVVDSSQCYCGHRHPPADHRRDDSECAVCESDRSHGCGAAQVQSVYQACAMPRSAWVSEGEYIGGLQTTGDLAFTRG